MNFTERIDESIFKRFVEAEVRPRKPHQYWPSEASIVIPDKLGNPKVEGKCLRACYYKIKEFPITNFMSPSRIRKIETGKVIEQQEHVYARDAGVLVDHNIKKMKEYGNIAISSEIDALYKNESTNIIIDIKSYYGYQAKKEIEGGMRSIGRPKLGHVLQMMLYLDIFTDVPYAILRYIDRGDMNIVEHKVELANYRIKNPTQGGDEFIEDRIAVVNSEADTNISLSRILVRYYQLDSLVESNTLPPRDYSPKYSKEEIAYKQQIGELSKTSKARADAGKPLSDWNCLAENQVILTKNGFKPIGNVTTKDSVLSSDGNYHKVINIGSKLNDRQMMEIKPYSCRPIQLTYDHPILIRYYDSLYQHYNINNPTDGFLTCEQILDLDYFQLYIAFQIDNHISNLELTDDELDFLGYYIAEVCKANEHNGKYYRIQFCLNQNELEFADKIVSLAKSLFDAHSLVTDITDKRNGYHYKSIYVYSRKAVEFIEKFVVGNKAIKKEFVPDILHLNPQSQYRLFMAACRGDGSRVMIKDRQYQFYSSASYNLVLQFQLMLLRNNIIANITYNKPSSNRLSQNGCYHVKYSLDKTVSFGYIEQGKLYLTLQYIKPIDYSGNVFDIEVEGIHDFQTASGIVHNCSYCPYLYQCLKD